MTHIRHLNHMYALFGGAKSLVAVFGSIYLIQSGFGLRDIILYFIMTAIVKIACLWLVFPLAARYGARRLVITGICLMVVHFVWFASLQHSYLWLGILAALLGAANAFFYPSFRILFSQATHHDTVSRSVASQNNYTIIASALAPIMGGAVASLLDIRLTYLIAALLFAGAALLTLRLPRAVPKLQFHLRRIPRGGALRDYAANASYSFSGLADTSLWPLYLAVIIPTYAGIGAYTGFAVVLTLITQTLVGRISSPRSERTALYGGIVLSSLYGVGRAVATTVSQLIGLGFVNALGSALLAGAYGTRFYKNIHPEHHLEYLFAMELANSVTWLVYFPILLLATVALSDESVLRLGILLVIPAVFGMALMRIYKPRTM